MYVYILNMSESAGAFRPSLVASACAQSIHHQHPLSQASHTTCAVRLGLPVPLSGVRSSHEARCLKAVNEKVPSPCSILHGRHTAPLRQTSPHTFHTPDPCRGLPLLPETRPDVIHPEAAAAARARASAGHSHHEGGADNTVVPGRGSAPRLKHWPPRLALARHPLLHPGSPAIPRARESCVGSTHAYISLCPEIRDEASQSAGQHVAHTHAHTHTRMHPRTHAVTRMRAHKHSERDRSHARRSRRRPRTA